MTWYAVLSTANTFVTTTAFLTNQSYILKYSSSFQDVAPLTTTSPDTFSYTREGQKVHAIIFFLFARVNLYEGGSVYTLVQWNVII